MRSYVRKRLVCEEAGFSFSEVLVTMLIMIIVLFSLYGIFDMSLRVFSVGNDKVEATEQTRLGMEKMEREIRAAYPVDRISGQQHVFFPSGSLSPANSAPTLPEAQSITFGNDLRSSAWAPPDPPPPPPEPPNRKVDAGEAITYELRLTNPDGTLGAPGSCPDADPDDANPQGVCSLARRKGSTSGFQPVVEYVVPDGLTFEYLRNNLDPATVANGTDIGVVRITLEVAVDRGIQEQPVTQTLTNDVDLRNRGG